MYVKRFRFKISALIIIYCRNYHITPERDQTESRNDLHLGSGGTSSAFKVFSAGQLLLTKSALYRFETNSIIIYLLATLPKLESYYYYYYY